MYSPHLIFYLSTVYRSVYWSESMKIESLVRFIERWNLDVILLVNQ